MQNNIKGMRIANFQFSDIEMLPGAPFLCIKDIISEKTFITFIPLLPNTLCNFRILLAEPFQFMYHWFDDPRRIFPSLKDALSYLEKLLINNKERIEKFLAFI